MQAQNISFFVIAAAMVFAAFRVVTSTNVVRAALYLVVVLAGVAAQYILLAAEFTAVVQVLIYIGAIIVLFLFGIMLTRAPIGRSSDLDNDQRWLAVLVSLLLFGVLAWTLNDAFSGAKIRFTGGPQTTAQVGDSIFSTYLLPFEVVSVLLLAALVGAIVLARRD
ncbi:MAG TPA: NADH-quinone oxidoreductase subunit J [Acidimicrobiales bacterium]|jgi:NADH-quinone oxidoreductase subunit J|nr:NADH-quinone oxidoreductase subunit J [Acidimicrobiales bacterium]